MGIDKLRIITTDRALPSFIEEVAEDMALPRHHRTFELRVHEQEDNLSKYSRCFISTRKGVTPFLYLSLNYPRPKAGEEQILEVNPNKMPEGLRDLHRIIDRVFGPDCGDFRIARIDPSADSQVPVDYFFRALRIPRKRKSTRYLQEPLQQTYSDRGQTGFLIGRSPALFRVYDKREEMKRSGKDLAYYPKPFTRVEWEFRNKRCPVRRLSQLPDLFDYRPFDSLEFLDTDKYYDFHNQTVEACKKFLLDQLAATCGGHEAARILNKGRHFKREFSEILITGNSIKADLQNSYTQGLQLLFDNKCPDQRYSHAQSVDN